MQEEPSAACSGLIFSVALAGLILGAGQVSFRIPLALDNASAAIRTVRLAAVAVCSAGQSGAVVPTANTLSCSARPSRSSARGHRRGFGPDASDRNGPWFREATAYKNFQGQQ